MTLSQIYGTVKQVCLMDDNGVYLNDERIALDNSHNNGYIRRNGARSLDRIGGCDGSYNSELPLIFVGAVPGGDPEQVEAMTIAALTNSSNTITNVEIQKDVIAESEGISLEDLQKFDGVAMVLVEYTQSTVEIYDPKCTPTLC